MSGDEPSGLEPLEVHVGEGATELDLASEPAHVDPAAGERGEDPHAVRIGERREDADQPVAIESCHV